MNYFRKDLYETPDIEVTVPHRKIMMCLNESTLKYLERSIGTSGSNKTFDTHLAKRTLANIFYANTNKVIRFQET